MKKTNIFNNSRLLVTGGTGSFGYNFIDKVLKDFKPKEIRVLSRDEKKQYDMRNHFRNPILNFIIGDVRERETVFKAMKDINYVFNAAALKQVPACEFFPIEAVKTNILGAHNVLDASEESGVKKVVILSTDKAVHPINAMGMTKALMEKLMLSKARATTSKTVFCGVRYGNVMYSRGSVIPLFVNLIKQNKPLTITEPEMTRFLLPLPTAIDLVIFALEKGGMGDVLVRKSPASTMLTLAEAMIKIFNFKKGYKIVGIREGEKIHETLVTKEEMIRAEEFKDYYSIKNLASVDYDKFYVKGSKIKIPDDDYTSANTKRLNLKETLELLLSLKDIKNATIVP
jgi:UDP-N-acetylglucosamine 4,6-dehydratase/5-epimerase